MHRFFLPPECITPTEVCFPTDTSRQIRLVLRLKAGERVMALDGRGHETQVELTVVEKGDVRGRVIESHPVQGEPASELILYLALAQREKFEWMLQKCTELGASVFVPILTQRTLLRSRKSSPARVARWQAILKEAAEQSGRGRVPRLEEPQTLADALPGAARRSDLALIAWEGERSLSLAQALQNLGGKPKHGFTELAVFIGPEGGFAEDEIAMARKAGVIPFSLGPRVLRMETAAMAVTALVMAEMEG